MCLSIFFEVTSLNGPWPNNHETGMGSVEPKVATYVEFAELLGLRGSDLGILHMKTIRNVDSNTNFLF